MRKLSGTEFEHELESWIDAHGLVYVTTLLETICSEKAEHLRSNWQDANSAKSWDRDSKKLAAISQKIEN